MDKRCFTTAEAMEYLGTKRRSFEAHIVPRCTGIPIGTSVVYERTDLDQAWEKYKASLQKPSQVLQSDRIDAGSKRPEEKGEIPWDAAKRPASTQRRTGTRSTNVIRVSAFDNAALAVLKRQKAG